MFPVPCQPGVFCAICGESWLHTALKSVRMPQERIRYKMEQWGYQEGRRFVRSCFLWLGLIRSSVVSTKPYSSVWKCSSLKYQSYRGCYTLHTNPDHLIVSLWLKRITMAIDGYATKIALFALVWVLLCMCVCIYLSACLYVLEWPRQPSVIYRDSEKLKQMKHIKEAKGIHKTQSRFYSTPKSH